MTNIRMAQVANSMNLASKKRIEKTPRWDRNDAQLGLVIPEGVTPIAPE
jgi:hypothetical protein